MKRAIVESQYCGSILYYHLLSSFDEVIIDDCENLAKGSYRNRCYIFGANGRLRLSIPLAKGKHQRRAMKDVLISNEYRWQQIHWQSLCSAYRTSSFFEYYEHEFEFIYKQKYDRLYDFNRMVDEKIRAILKLEYNVCEAEEYHPSEIWHKKDVVVYRDQMNPRKPEISGGNTFSFEEYYQVFSNKLPFEANLSILDLIFNLGPAAGAYLENGVKLVK